jgi:hypothetical protein
MKNKLDTSGVMRTTKDIEDEKILEEMIEREKKKTKDFFESDKGKEFMNKILFGGD